MAREGVAVYGEGRPIGRPSTRMAQRRPLGYDLPDWVRFGLASGCSQRQGLAIFRRAGGQVRTYEWGVVWRQEQARMDKTGRLPRP